MPLVRREGQQRIVPDHAVDAYKDAGWTVDGEEAAPEPFPSRWDY